MRLRIMVFLAVNLCFCTLVNPAGALEPSRFENSTAPLQQPLLFEPNFGQAEPGVEYLARSRGYMVYLTKEGAQILFRN